jgi:ATP-dependent helicase YprA (DUF1998 family)
MQLAVQALKSLGYSDFRDCQEEVIQSTMEGRDTVGILQTGSGKSLCFMVPAKIHADREKGAKTVVISPLIALMEDQVKSANKLLSGGGGILQCFLVEETAALMLKSLPLREQASSTCLLKNQIGS